MFRSLLSASAFLFLPASCWAQCGPLPHALANGQTADATQVMDNFNLVLNCASSAAPINYPNFNNAITISGTPFIVLYNGNNGADQKRWDQYAVGSTLGFRAVNDAYSDGHPWMLVNRGSGYTISNVTFPGITVYGGSFVGGNFASPSDRRLKANIKATEYGLSTILRLRPVDFDWDRPQGGRPSRDTGLIAQDVQSVLPQAVSIQADDLKTLNVSYMTIIPVLIKAIQEQQVEIEALKSQSIGHAP